ncbi:MAG: 3-deoxy-manno-octulosonate cytidylyltransferase [Chromatiaceae bacterium]|nr:3-deoxy-manno-octulosonate cytidylyltransferase [Gammaproteobacteria bacterium]MCP5445652.1 3-deoxy-manno-octulosonate cytidylyltransferase [Chromatiaceae bacterium]MCB1860624.1 3-deoxy-manno-octulosonate cytidylyltransferase [Gammaproteobacteria bacterium]MCB1873619.1 3-deoxy-manno-octulosonate cytidylyltransferase [Gammaproteobacteria bacterium]MCB1879769.1 3-deoxy-manno-octulosonate cytidylyltransferase [Gammaproteobacteria bacterium]
MRFKVVIPARYASSRLPGKPLLEIAGKPMIQHVYERAVDSGADEVIIATDDSRIAECVRSFSAQVCMTASHHASGTERIAEVVRCYAWKEDTIVVNLQGDEPRMPAALLAQVAQDMNTHTAANMTTLAGKIISREQLFDPHTVKVVTDIAGYALYFSRAPLPWHRDEFLRENGSLPVDTQFLRHIGLYAYRAGFLEQYINWPQSQLERAESLEQLRVLWHGGRIHVSEALKEPGHGVDTQDDINRVKRQFRSDKYE